MKNEPTYEYVKGKGWVPTYGRIGRPAQQTMGMPFHELRSGDAVYVYVDGITRVARFHQEGDPIPMEPDDTGSWVKSGTFPAHVRLFGKTGDYQRHDSAWTRLIGISFPGGKDYEV
jgi:hypothetical protein